MVELIEEDNKSDDAVPVKPSKQALDQFDKLRKAKNEKNKIEAASKILKSVTNSQMEVEYTIKRLITGLAGASSHAREGFYICLTDLIRQTGLTYQSISKLMSENLKLGGTLTKGEEADYLIGQLLVLSAMLRSGIVNEDTKIEVAEQLIEISQARSYFLLPVIKLFVEHFIGKGDVKIINLLTSGISLKIENLNIDTLYLLLSIYKMDEGLCTDKFLEGIGIKKIFGKKALEAYCTCLLNVNMPPSVFANHKVIPVLISLLAQKDAFSKFWTILVPQLNVTNNKGHLGWIILKQIGMEKIEVVPEMLTTHTLSVGAHLANRQASTSIIKNVIDLLITGVEAGKVDNLKLMKKLLDFDLCWEKSPAGGISQLLSKADFETVQEVGKIYISNVKSNEKVAERVHCASMLVKIVSLPLAQQHLEWKLEILQTLASVSSMSGVTNVIALNSNGREQMKEMLFRGLDSRNKTLEDSVFLVLETVKYIRKQLDSGATRNKALNAEQQSNATKALSTIETLESKWIKEKKKENGVFIYLFCQMWLQMFSHPELASEVLVELFPVHDRWKKGSKKGVEEPGWVDVVVEILISLLAQNNHLLRSVVGSVFSVIGKDLTVHSMDSLLAVLKQGNEDGKDSDDDEDDEDEESEAEAGDDESDASSESDSDDEENEDDENATQNPSLLKNVSEALGNHAADSDSDIDMDEVPDEDMAKLDEKLVEAFKAIGGRKDRASKKKENLQNLANMHFKLRVLELIELYLNNSPNPLFIPSIVSALIESLDKALKLGVSYEPLVNRLKSVLGKVATTKLKIEENAEAGADIIQTLSSLFELSSSGSVVVNHLGAVFPRVMSSCLLRLGKQVSKPQELTTLYCTWLKKWLHEQTCVLPNDIFTLALSHAWPGCWDLASTMATSVFSPEVRNFRKVAIVLMLTTLLKNKMLVDETPEEIRKLAEQLAPAIIKELERIKDSVGKMIPKYLFNVFSILRILKDLPFDLAVDWSAVSKCLENLSSAWPSNNRFGIAKGELLKLGAKLGTQIQIVVKESISSNAEKEATVESKKKKKKKNKKSQESLKKAKELKLKFANIQENSECPSFADFVEDKINADTLSSPSKRKAEDSTGSEDVLNKKSKSSDNSNTKKSKKKKNKT